MVKTLGSSKELSVDLIDFPEPEVSPQDNFIKYFAASIWGNLWRIENVSIL